jgi:hypothetical protein
MILKKQNNMLKYATYNFRSGHNPADLADQPAEIPSGQICYSLTYLLKT